jgi:hypothetical protein
MEEQIFGLGAGRLYIAPATVSEADATSLTYYAGPTKGGVTLSYTAKTHDILGWGGEVVRTIRYGDRLKLTGRLSRLYPRVLAAATSGTLKEGVVTFGGAPTRRVRVVLVADLPEEAGGGETVFSFLAAAASPFSLSLTPDHDSGWEFCLLAETDGAGFTGKWVIGS